MGCRGSRGRKGDDGVQGHIGMIHFWKSCHSICMDNESCEHLKYSNRFSFHGRFHIQDGFCCSRTVPFLNPPYSVHSTTQSVYLINSREALQPSFRMDHLCLASFLNGSNLTLVPTGAFAIVYFVEKTRYAVFLGDQSEIFDE